MSSQQRRCSCGRRLQPIKNWTRLSKWRRLQERRCQQCASTKHGMSRTRLYREWASMRERCGLTRCSNPSARKYYIERGITVADEWKDFATFAAWSLANGYADDLSLDRKEASKGYSADNCRWISIADNLRSRTDRKLSMTIAKEIRRNRKNGDSLNTLAERYGVSANHIYKVCAEIAWSETCDR